MSSVVSSFMKKHANEGNRFNVLRGFCVKRKQNLNVEFECNMHALYLAWYLRTNYVLGLRD